eukprot:TRINITY_DN11282_c0_g1_i2.p1 TRINITY_DN11282_c0_g1~~TRINITY_DN11282_c0_g1_i2.p1  ORF type:complete len:820 (+),score=169.30 TRINITY_DN11282_c0_g1_i2:33-2462(+)
MASPDELEQQLWAKAVAWLNGFGIIPSDEPVLQPEAGAYDLAVCLQDGTVLCNLIQKLLPALQLDMHSEPTKQFEMINNINLFLAHARSSLRIRDSFLFTAEELYYASDLHKVIVCLSEISKHPNALSRGVDSFKIGLQQRDSFSTDAGVYVSLENMMSQSLSLRSPTRRGRRKASFFNEEDVYESLQSSSTDEAEHLYLMIIYGTIKREESIYGSSVGPDEKRSMVAQELHETERNFVDVLKVIVNTFRQTLVDAKVPSATLEVAFPNIDELLVAHEAFLKALDETMGQQDGRMFSKLFMSHMQTFRCYGHFCAKLPEALIQITKLLADRHVAAKYKAAKESSGQKFELKDLMRVPMQRVLKYPLLLKELIKSTPKEHPDAQALPKAKAAVEDLAVHINETKRDYDNLTNLMKVLRKYTGPPLHDYGNLVMDGDVWFEHRAIQPKGKIRYVFLFSKAVIVCKAKGAIFNYKGTIPLEPFMKVEFGELNVGQKTHAATWLLVASNGHKTKLGVNSIPTRRKWVKALKERISAMPIDELSSPPSVLPRPSLRNRSGSAPGSPRKTVPPLRHNEPGRDKKSGYEDWQLLDTGERSDSPVPPASLDQEWAGAEDWFVGRPTEKPDKVDDKSSNVERHIITIALTVILQMLEGMPDGTFLVRESDSRQGAYSLSVIYQDEIRHLKIIQEGAEYKLAPDGSAFDSIQSLVVYFHNHSLKRHFPHLPTTLGLPYRSAVLAQSKPHLPGAEFAVITGLGRARAKFDYAPQDPDELMLKKGQELVILSTSEQDDGWWRCRKPDGEVGLVPANHVQRL